MGPFLFVRIALIFGIGYAASHRMWWLVGLLAAAVFLLSRAGLWRKKR
jgi:hypothetical protein